MDGIPALDLWDLVIEVLHSSKNQPVQGELLRDEAQKKHTNTKTKKKKHISRDDIELFNVDHVTTNAKPSHFGALLYNFEDNEAVIKMRSPTMRHVSRTHRVALDWLFDRNNLDPKIQIKYVDTKKQLADMLTKGSFTSDEWNRLLRLLNIMSFPMFSCSHLSPIHNLQTMSMRMMQEEKNWRRGTCGYEIRTNEEFGVEDCRSVSNRTGVECILQLGDAQSTKFEFGPHQHWETLGERCV